MEDKGGASYTRDWEGDPHGALFGKLEVRLRVEGEPALVRANFRPARGGGPWMVTGLGRYHGRPGVRVGLSR